MEEYVLSSSIGYLLYVHLLHYLVVKEIYRCSIVVDVLSGTYSNQDSLVSILFRISRIEPIVSCFPLYDVEYHDIRRSQPKKSNSVVVKQTHKQLI